MATKPVPAPSPAPRGPKPKLTREQIIAAASERLERDGLAGLSLRSLAGDLGVSPMGLYRYFADKEELLDAVGAAALQPAVDAPSAADPWDRQLEAMMRGMYAALDSNPGHAELLATRTPGRPLDALRERLLEAVADTGWSQERRADALRALTSYVLGFALVADAGAAGASPGTSAKSFEFGLALLMTSLKGGVGGGD